MKTQEHRRHLQIGTQDDSIDFGGNSSGHISHLRLYTLDMYIFLYKHSPIKCCISQMLTNLPSEQNVWTLMTPGQLNIVLLSLDLKMHLWVVQIEI